MAAHERSLAEILAHCIADLELSSADGRADLSAMMRQLEKDAPDQIMASAARLQLRALGLTVRG